MTIRAIAERLPDDVRKQILQENIVSNAVPTESNLYMHYLLTMWVTYVEPNIDTRCPKCKVRILENYRSLLPLLIEIEKESKLIDSAG